MLHPFQRSGTIGKGGAVSLTPIERLWQTAQVTAASLPAFAVRADRRLRSAVRGIHGRRRAGAGESFWQFRPYEAGEPASRIDWRRSARSDALYVRQHEWETAQNVWFWVDGSRSMHFRSRLVEDSKADRAAILALAAAKLMVGAGERVAYYGLHDRAAGGSFGLERLLAALDRERAGVEDAFPSAHELPRHAHLVLIGDFLDEEDVAKDKLRRLVSLGVQGHLLQIVDPVEEDFPYSGRVTFEGLDEDEEVLLNRADALGGDYRRRMKAWTESIGTMCRRVGWTHSVHRTDYSPSLALIGLMSLIGRGA